MFNYKKIITWLLNFVQIQLFLTLLSLPILITWGLPLSIAAPLGNLIFLPFLMAFLFISANIFFLELLSLPNSWFIAVLEKITALWLWLISIGNPSWLISFAQPAWYILCAVPLCAFVLLYHKRFQKIMRSCVVLLLLLLFIALYLKYRNNTHEELLLEIPCNNGKLTLVKKGTITMLIDPGVLGQRISTPSWIEYTLLPLLNKQFGDTTIDHLIVLQPSIMTFQSLEKIAHLCCIKHCYIPYWQGTSDKQLLRCYGFMKRSMAPHKTMFHRIGQTEIYPLKNTCITPLLDTINYKDVSFPAFLVSIELKNKMLAIYSVKKPR